MRTSESIQTIAPALLKAQKAIGPAIKDKTNPLYKSKYADLHAVMKACLDALNGNGLVLLQTPVHSEDSKVHMTTRLQHESGEYMEETFSIPAQKQDPHGYGSACTYLRRFSVSAWLGIVTEEDDDGNAASKVPNASSAAADKIIAANKEHPSHATQVMHDALAAMDVEEQNRMRDIAVQVTDAFGENAGGEARAVFLGFHLDQEQQLAVGSLLTPKIRNAIKNARTNGELSTQP